MIILGVDLGKVRTGLAVCDRGDAGIAGWRHCGMQP